MKTHSLGIIMNGVTGRMGAHQHLARSIMAIRAQGGVKVCDGERILPEPVLVGRNEHKLRLLSEAHGGLPYTTDLDSLWGNRDYPVYFDAQTTSLRAESVLAAIRAGKHIYCEKPTAGSFTDAVHLYQQAAQAGVKHGVVQDKLWLPGVRKLQLLIKMGFFGRILSVRGEFGYWVFTGEDQPAQRPAWNYRKADGGGVILDMLCHWRYLIDNLFGNVVGVSCLGACHIPERWDEDGQPYQATADDAAYATFMTDKNIVCQFNSSWCVRVRRDDLLTLQVDGTEGSAVAGLRDCFVQHHSCTPRPVWNPDIENPINFHDSWQRMPDNHEYENAFKAQWDLFLKHVVLDEPFPWDLLEGAKGVQLAELGLASHDCKSWREIKKVSF